MTQTPTTPYNPKITDGDGNTLYDGFTVIHIMELWYDWFVEIRPWNHDEPYQLFLGLWDHYQVAHKEDFLRLYSTTYGAYDPLSNYDMLEQSLDGRKLDDITDTTTPHGKTTTTAEIQGTSNDTTTMYKTGLGSGGTDTKTDKIETVNTPTNRKTVTDITYDTGTDTERKTVHTNNQSGNFDGSTLSGYHEVSEHYIKRKGNIGVQSAQDLIQKETDIRKDMILVQYIKQFFQLYGYFTRGVS